MVHSFHLHSLLLASFLTHLDTLVAAALAAAHAEPPQEASVPIREPSEPPEAGRVCFSSAISIVFFFFFFFFSSSPSRAHCSSPFLKHSSHVSSRTESRRVMT